MPRTSGTPLSRWSNDTLGSAKTPTPEAHMENLADWSSRDDCLCRSKLVEIRVQCSNETRHARVLAEIGASPESAVSTASMIVSICGYLRA